MGAQRIVIGMDMDVEHQRLALVDRLLEPVEGFVHLSESFINDREAPGRHVLRLSALPKFLEDFQGFSRPACLSINPAETSQGKRAASRSLC